MDTELIRPGGGTWNSLLQFLQLFLVQTVYKAKVRELIRPGAPPEIALTIHTIPLPPPYLQQ